MKHCSIIQHRNGHQLQTAVTWVLDELEGNPKKENHQNTIPKMLGTNVQGQLYTLSSRSAIHRPQKWLKIADWGVRTVKIAL